MVKVTVDKFKRVLSDFFLHKTFPRLLHLGFRRHSFEKIIDDMRVNTDVHQEPLVLGSMFPSLFDGIRLGRPHKSASHMELRDAEKPSKSSSNVRIIPIRVSESHSQQTTRSVNEMNPIILDDDTADLTDYSTEDISAFSKHAHRGLNRLTSSAKNKITDSTIILDDEDIQEVVHIDNFLPTNSRPSSHKSSTESHSHTVSMKQASIQQKEQTHEPHAIKKANTCSEEKMLPLINSNICKDDGIMEKDADFSDKVIVSDLHDSGTLSLKTRDGHFEELQNSSPPDNPTYDMLTVKLACENRKLHYITGDGNCFFRALSKIIYGSENYHREVRSLVIDIIATNKSKFAQFIDGEDVQEHIEKMSEDRCWATTCEIYAAATVLQTKIFIFTPNHSCTSYAWLLFKPLFKIPQESDLTKYQCCITLCNTNGIHYDLIVADHGKCNCFLTHPKLGGFSAVIDLS